MCPSHGLSSWLVVPRPNRRLEGRCDPSLRRLHVCPFQQKAMCAPPLALSEHPVLGDLFELRKNTCPFAEGNSILGFGLLVKKNHRTRLWTEFHLAECKSSKTWFCFYSLSRHVIWVKSHRCYLPSGWPWASSSLDFLSGRVVVRVTFFKRNPWLCSLLDGKLFEDKANKQ